jgi:hypothetical protein
MMLDSDLAGQAGYDIAEQRVMSPQYIGMQRVSLPIPLTHAKTNPVHYKELVKVSNC